MSLITYFQNLREEGKRKKEARNERNKINEIIKKREEWYKRLDEIPREEMFKVLREVGGIKSLKELQKANQLSPRIQQIWDLTKDDMFELSMSFEKMRYLYDASHLYFITHEKYKSWDRDTKYFLVALARLNTLNTFFEINELGYLYYLNPLDEPVDTSHDDEIRALFQDFHDKLVGFCSHTGCKL